MSGTLAGTGNMVRLVLRRDRIRLSIWILALVGLTGASASAVASTYRTPEQIAAYDDTMGSSPAVVALSGPPAALDTLGGILVYETSLTVLLGVALMAMFTVVRHTRAEEDDGRTELLRSTVVGLHAHLTGVLLVVSGASVLVGAGVALGVVAADGASGSALVYGAAVAAMGIVFAAVAGLMAQLMANARGALGATGALLGLAFLLRAIGDVRGGALSWLSPMGWSQQVLAFEADRWWPLLLSVLAAAAMVAGALALETRRDVGAGIVPPRPGPTRAAAGLGTPVGLLVRLQRGTVLGWAFGILFFGVTFGSLSREIQSMVDSNPELAAYFATVDATVVDSFFTTAMVILSLAASGFAVSSVLRTRSEESAGRLEPLLATPVSRTSWLTSGIAVTVVSSALVVGLGGLGIGAAHAVITSSLAPVWELTGAALTYLPAVLVLAGLATLVLGWAPRLVGVCWAVVAFCFVIGWLGGAIDFPEWMRNLSPFTHVPAVPAEPTSWAPLLVLTALAGALAAVGVVGFRRRDLG